MDFACKQISVDDVLKCSLGLTKAKLSVLKHLRRDAWLTSAEIASRLELDVSTVQRALKTLTEKGIIERSQQNLGRGGYEFSYRAKGREVVRDAVMESIHNWTSRVEKELLR